MSTDYQQQINRLAPYQFKPGQSGNPLGINAGRKPSLLTALKRELESCYSDEPATKVSDRLAKRVVNIALHGEDDVALRAWSEIMNRTEGRPRQTIDLNSNEINLTFLAERLVDFAQKAKGVEIPLEVAEQLIANILELR